jgi:hypothetical protein
MITTPRAELVRVVLMGLSRKAVALLYLHVSRVACTSQSVLAPGTTEPLYPVTSTNAAYVC